MVQAIRNEALRARRIDRWATLGRGAHRRLTLESGAGRGERRRATPLLDLSHGNGVVAGRAANREWLRERSATIVRWTVCFSSYEMRSSVVT